MGTGASSYTPPPSPFRPLRTSSMNRRFEEAGLIFEGTLTRTDNHVAPVIIKNCMEEYQHVTDFTEPFVYGSIAEKMPEHLLIQGQYFLVKDLSAAECHSSGRAGNLHRAKCGVSVFTASQPSANELEIMLEKIALDGYPEILLFNMREEPVLFVARDGDFLPYTIKTRQCLSDCVVTGKLVKEADLFEANIRKEIIALATLNDENLFYFYDNLENLSGEPHLYHVEFEDNLLVSEEVYSRLAFSNPKLRYRRLCFPADGAPTDLEVDHFLSIIQASSVCSKTDENPAMLFTCQTGYGRSTVGAVMGYLVVTFRDCEQILSSGVSPHWNTEESSNALDREECRNIRKLIQLLPNGNLLRAQVDYAIRQCSSSYSLLDQIVLAKRELDRISMETIKNPHLIRQQYEKVIDFLSRYFFLICFNAYLRDQFSNRFLLTFTKWMQRHPEINHLRANIFLPVYNTCHSLLSHGIHNLVSDNYVGLDLLGTQMDLRVANFRKINIKTIPVYGMAQPTNDSLSKVVNHLLSSKVKHTHIVLVNLRNDMMVECDGATYSVRHADKIDEPITFPCFSKSELEENEVALRKIIKKNPIFQIYNELSDPPIERNIYAAYTILELAENQRLQTLDMSYYRVPLLSDASVMEQNIDDLMSVVCSHCKQERLKDNTDTAFVFFCRTGRSRSTFAMAVAGLILCHIRGFPVGSKVGEQERISLPNAQYTKGEFIIVQKLVRMLPNGQQVKREVDFMLDEIFNTMTPMMFHMREIIFVTFNKLKKAKSAEAREQCLGLSMLYLERYVYLILFNAYLHHDAESQWVRPFSTWMKEVGGRAGVYELLDNLAFYDFEDSVSDHKSLFQRWKLHVPRLTYHGGYA